MEERYKSDAAFFAEMCCDDEEVASSSAEESSSVGDQSTGGSARTTAAKAAGRKLHKLRIDGRHRVIDTKSVLSALSRTGYAHRINASRRLPSDILYVFPTFDKCDALLYFPTSMTRHLNSGDMESLGKLFNTHIDKNCNFNLSTAYKAVKSTHQMLKSCHHDSESQPDRILCVHTTKVVENKIVATIHAKFTDSAALHSSIARTHSVGLPLPASRYRTSGIRSQLVDSYNLKQPLKEEYIDIADSGADFVAYVSCTMTFGFDETSKKINSISCSGHVSSMHEVETLSRDL